jgi:hypothetical protein
LTGFFDSLEAEVLQVPDIDRVEVRAQYLTLDP